MDLSRECRACGQPIRELTTLPPELRIPCEVCKSLDRTMVHLNDGVSRWWLKEQKPTGGIRTTFESIYGRVQSIDGSIADVIQVIDRRSNRYRKFVRLADGTVTRDSDGPLTDHHGYGSAKK